MGYYSNVGLCLDQSASKKLQKAVLAITDTSLRQSVQDLFDCATFYIERGDILYRWEDIKWYDEESGWPVSTDNQFVMDFLKSLNKYSFHFIRVGEDYEDYQVVGEYQRNRFSFCLQQGYGGTPYMCCSFFPL